MSSGLSTMLEISRHEVLELRETISQERELSHKRHCEITRLKKQLADMRPWIVMAHSEFSSIAKGGMADQEFLQTLIRNLRESYESIEVAK